MFENRWRGLREIQRNFTKVNLYAQLPGLMNRMPFVMVGFGEFEFAININFRYVSENMLWEGKCETGETI